MKKKPLIVLAIIALLGAVGGTVAYLTTTKTLGNIFGTKYYHTEITEKFESPENWIPGTTTSKEVYVENTGDVDVAVRLSYTEKWISASGEELPLKQGENVAAIINFINEEDWILDGDYYYFKEKLLPKQKTTSFIESVTFNSAITADSVCTGEGTMKECTSTGNGYDGAKYILTIKVETIQYTARKPLWGIEDEEVEDSESDLESEDNMVEGD